MTHTKYTLMMLALVMAMACKQAPDHSHDHDTGHSHEASGHDHDGHDDHDDHDAGSKQEVQLTNKQMEVMGIEMGAFQMINLSTAVKSNGTLELPPQNKASLSTVMGGRVKSILAVPGDRVTKGKTLAFLEHPDFVELQEQYLTAKSQLTLAQKELERKQKLFKDSISSSKSLEKAEADYQTSLAMVNSHKAKLEILDIDLKALEKGNFLSAIPVRSPIDGYVRLVEINIGKYVPPHQEMFEIVDNEHIHIDLMVYEKDMGKIKKGQQVMFTLPNHSDTILQGSIFAVGRAFEEDPKAMVVHAEIENKTGNLLPGMYVDARIIIDDRKAQALPDDAIVRDGALDYIFVLRQGSSHEHHHSQESGAAPAHDDHAHATTYTFERVEVSTGASDIGFTEAIPAQPLAENAKVVIKGAFYLLAEMKKGEGGGHGHSH